MNDSHKIYGLTGFPLGHSFSRAFFTDKFRRENIDAEYVNIELPHISDITDVILNSPALAGFNVTIPHKETIIPMLDSVDAGALAIGAVNVVKIDRNGGVPRLTGYNTDIIGFTESIRPLLHGTHSKALVLGSGGASKAVCAGLRSLGIEPLTVSRTPSGNSVSYSELDRETIASHTIIVNTTPLGMFPATDASPDIPYRHITPRHVCYDVIYNPAETLFMKRCAEAGATVEGGLRMLELQALAAWDIWNN